MLKCDMARMNDMLLYLEILNVRKYKNNLIKADEQERQLPSIAVNLMKIKRILCRKVHISKESGYIKSDIKPRIFDWLERKKNCMISHGFIYIGCAW